MPTTAPARTEPPQARWGTDSSSDVDWLVSIYCALCRGGSVREMAPHWLRCADGTVMALHLRVADLIHDDRRLIGDGAGLDWLADVKRLREQEAGAIGWTCAPMPPRDWGPLR